MGGFEKGNISLSHEFEMDRRRDVRAAAPAIFLSRRLLFSGWPAVLCRELRGVQVKTVLVGGESTKKNCAGWVVASLLFSGTQPGNGQVEECPDQHGHC